MSDTLSGVELEDIEVDSPSSPALDVESFHQSALSLTAHQEFEPGLSTWNRRGFSSGKYCEYFLFWREFYYDKLTWNY